MAFARGITGLLVIDPYNDFISEGGKVWDRLRGVAETNGCIGHMKQVLDAAREADIRVFYALHRRYRPGDYETWKYVAPIQKAAWERKTFEYGTWGGELRDEFLPRAGDIVADEHWCSSGFANTDLDLQLKKHGIHELIVVGLIAHTCVEATVRYAAELGYQVTVVKDATSSYSEDHMHITDSVGGGLGTEIAIDQRQQRRIVASLPRRERHRDRASRGIGQCSRWWFLWCGGDGVGTGRFIGSVGVCAAVSRRRGGVCSWYRRPARCWPDGTGVRRCAAPADR